MTASKQTAGSGEPFALSTEPDFTTVLELPAGVSSGLEIRTREGVVICLTMAPGSCLSVRNPPAESQLAEVINISFVDAPPTDQHSIH